MTDDIKNFTADPGADKRTSRGHLWSVATGDQVDESVTVDVAPDSMAGLDHVAMLRGDAEPEAADASEAINDGTEHSYEQLPTVANAPALDGRQEGVDDLAAFELPYADGSTTPPKPANRHRLWPRQRTVPADHELEAAIAETTSDVWAAHRNDQFESDAVPASDQPTGMLTASKGQDRSRGRRPLALVAVVAVVLAGASIVAFGGGGGKAQASRAGITGGAKAHHKTHAPGSNVGTVTVPANVTSTTSAKLAARLKHKAKQKTRKRTVSHSTVATSTVTSAPVVTSTPKVTTSSTSAPKTFTPSSTSRSSTTHSSSSTSGGLPDLQQTAQQP
jgi:hypothetical protein